MTDLKGKQPSLSRLNQLSAYIQERGLPGVSDEDTGGGNGGSDGAGSEGGARQNNIGRVSGEGEAAAAASADEPGGESEGGQPNPEMVIQLVGGQEDNPTRAKLKALVSINSSSSSY